MLRITRENIAEYIEKGESDTIEFKRQVPSELKIIKKIISAFSNTKGGSIIFGYDELRKSLLGVNNAQVEKLKGMCSQLSASYNYSIYTINYDGMGNVKLWRLILSMLPVITCSVHRLMRM